MSRYGNYIPDFKMEPRFTFEKELDPFGKYVSICSHSKIQLGEKIILNPVPIGHIEVSNIFEVDQYFYKHFVSMKGQDQLRHLIRSVEMSGMCDWVLLFIHKNEIKIYGPDENGDSPIMYPRAISEGMGPGNEYSVEIEFHLYKSIEPFIC